MLETFFKCGKKWEGFKFLNLINFRYIMTTNRWGLGHQCGAKIGVLATNVKYLGLP